MIGLFGLCGVVLGLCMALSRIVTEIYARKLRSSQEIIESSECRIHAQESDFHAEWRSSFTSIDFVGHHG